MSTASYTTLNDPIGVKGTSAEGIYGNNNVGYYYDGSGNAHGFEAMLVPEPSAIVLAGLGTVSLLSFRRNPTK
jgi:hypothetical protein